MDPTPAEVRELVEGPTRIYADRALEVYGDVMALSLLVPTDDVRNTFDAASFLTGAEAALIALARGTAILPSDVLAALEGGDS